MAETVIASYGLTYQCGNARPWSLWCTTSYSHLHHEPVQCKTQPPQTICVKPGRIEPPSIICGGVERRLSAVLIATWTTLNCDPVDLPAEIALTYRGLYSETYPAGAALPWWRSADYYVDDIVFHLNFFEGCFAGGCFCHRAELMVGPEEDRDFTYNDHTSSINDPLEVEVGRVGQPFCINAVDHSITFTIREPEES